MFIHDSYEIEVTNRCNALCPQCPRTDPKTGKLSSNMNIRDITIEEFEKIFPYHLVKNKKFHFCGLSGDCMANKHMPEIIDYLIYGNPKSIILSTNGGIGDKKFYKYLAEYSKQCNIRVNFAVDGLEDTNHLYRKGVKWKKLIENMKAYEGGESTVKTIVFDHNEHQLDDIEDLVKQFGFKSYIKRSKRIERKNNIAITNQYDIECRYIKNRDIYISADLKLWPCCFIHYDHYTDNDDYAKIADAYGTDFNDLTKYSIEQILSHEWFVSVLQESFDPIHNMTLESCYQHCRKNIQDVKYS